MDLDNIIGSLKDSEVEREVAWSEFEPYVIYKGKEMNVEDFISTVKEELEAVQTLQKLNGKSPVDVILVKA